MSATRFFGCVMLAVSVLTGCAVPSKPAQRAPVEDRTAGARTGAAPKSPAPATGALVAMGAENAGKPGYYMVRPGDTLIRIGLETGQNWRDLQAWNGLSNPNVIEVGQVLRVIPPSAPVATPVASAPAVAAAPTTPTTAPVPAAQASPRPLPAAGSETAAAPAAAPSAPATPAAAASEEIGFVWPVSGAVIEAFDEAKNKGVDLAGRLGEPVLASADGRVVYAGAGLRGYGNLIILKHNNTFLTAYAHNQALLVKEDQSVRQGQKIAEMGSSDADRVKLHFEIRRQGKPVDPVKLLPAR
jgi:lipoprotein NlpD